ncbi:hypothetical protein DFJ58DRAFT_732510 [Suillus subalutaceus]|uniref:uncharacterized protein n=1 Tax=Suillus subalutaceus TaxID=48586 RepID=UPI001B8658C8|nr:uncharacterized protein DFJ58DRAFT_732510 [Suillus subalutaceus]KAG1841211.1 hypothetical protein DFJ58DRAFT_732510 [Suillus subalutaceus]
MTVTTATTKSPTERLTERMMREGENDEHWQELADALPSQPPVARPLTPEFEFQYSRDEDDVVALTSLDKTSRNEALRGPQDISPGLQRQQSQHIETITLKPEDVLQCHHEKNRKPRLPDPDSLKLLNQETESSVQPSRAKRSKASGSGPTPDQLSWYGPRWKRFMEDCQSGMSPATCPGESVSSLGTVNNLKLGFGLSKKLICPRLLYDDLSTWRSDLKKTAISIAPLSYSLIPLLSVPAQERAAWIEHAAAGLIKESLFFTVWGWTKWGKREILPIPPFVRVAIAFFYTGPLSQPF